MFSIQMHLAAASESNKFITGTVFAREQDNRRFWAETSKLGKQFPNGIFQVQLAPLPQGLTHLYTTSSYSIPAVCDDLISLFLFSFFLRSTTKKFPCQPCTM
jgi:hypothetical protein